MENIILCISSARRLQIAFSFRLMVLLAVGGWKATLIGGLENFLEARVRPGHHCQVV